MNTTWDAEKYGSDFSYVPEYGRELIGLIDAGKGASVLDLGCGNGTLTRKNLRTADTTCRASISPMNCCP